MTEKSPASSIHSMEPVTSSFDGNDAAPAASNDDQPPQPDQPVNSGGDGDATGQAQSLPAAESSPESSKPADTNEAPATETVDEDDKLKMSTLKELTVVS